MTEVERVARALAGHCERADAILSSDWLRDTLAAERRAGFIAARAERVERRK